MVAQLKEVLEVVSQVESSGELSSTPSTTSPRSCCLFWPRADDATSADGTAVARPAGEVRPRGVPRQNQKSKGPVVKPGLPGPEQMTRPAPALQQWQKLLLSLGLLLGSQNTLPRPKCPVVKRHRRWDAEGLLQVKGVPWDHVQKDADLGEVRVRWMDHSLLLKPVVAEDDGPKRRRARLNKDDFYKFGFTDRCLGCQAIIQDGETRPHTEHCRARLENEIRNTTEGQVRLQKAKGETRCRDDSTSGFNDGELRMQASQMNVTLRNKSRVMSRSTWKFPMWST